MENNYGKSDKKRGCIQRNHVYTVNVTLKRLGGGSADPEVPADPAALTVTVEPQEWATELVQNVEW